jgi:divalent metal cation (Fe/Co/Zn/Cd) transporter
VIVTRAQRDVALRRARHLNAFTIAWNSVEAAVGLLAGAMAGSISLVGFGVDSVIELSSAVVLAWRLGRERQGGCTQDADRRAQRGVAVSFGLVAAYVGSGAVRDLVAGDRPEVSAVGVVLAGASLVVMPLLVRAKKRLSPILGSRAQAREANQTSVCAYLSAALLAGLSGNAGLGWWWADPVAGLVIAAIASVEAVRTWRAESLADTCCA